MQFCYKILSNYPIAGKSFDRNQMYLIESKFNDFGEFLATLEFHIPGAYIFKVQLLNWYIFFMHRSDNSKEGEYTGSLLVQPYIYLNRKQIPIQSICLQTVLTRCLGPITHWMERLKPTSEVKIEIMVVGI